MQGAPPPPEPVEPVRQPVSGYHREIPAESRQYWEDIIKRREALEAGVEAAEAVREAAHAAVEQRKAQVERESNAPKPQQTTSLVEGPGPEPKRGKKKTKDR